MQPQITPEAIPPATRSPLQGLVTIFYSPTETFENAGRPPWLVPLIAAALLSLLINVMVINVIGMGTIMRNQLESNQKLADQLGPEKVNQMVQEAETSSSRKIITYVFSVVGLPIVLCIIAGITYGLLLATGALTKFPAVLGAISWPTYGVLVITAIGSAIFLAAVNDYSGVDPQQMVMLNASIFFDKETSKGWVRALASGFDLVAFWSLFVQTIGLHKLSQQVSIRQAAAVVITLYLVWIFGKAGFAALFS